MTSSYTNIWAQFPPQNHYCICSICNLWVTFIDCKYL